MAIDTTVGRSARPPGPPDDAVLPARSVELRAEIEAVMGFFPPFFRPALRAPDLLEGMWRLMIGVYTSPVRMQFNARLWAYLSKCCDVPYCTVVQSCHLLELGWTTGQVAELLRAPSGVELDAPARDALWATRPAVVVWPDDGSALDRALHHGAIRMFLARDAAEWRAALRHALSEELYAHLVAFLTFIESTFRWIEAHPEMTAETAPWVQTRLAGLLEDQPGLRPLLALETFAETHPGARPMHSDPHGDDRLRKVFSESPIGIVIVAPDFRILEVNAALCDLLGYHEHELIGMTFVDVTHPDDVAIDVELAEQLFAGTIPSFRIEKRYVTQSGNVVWVLLTASVIHDRDGRPLYGLGMVKSIDERKQAEATLREHTKELERSNAELHEFTRVVSHDLKEPLRTIAGFSNRLEQRLVARDALTDTDTAECLTSIEASCGQMSELIDGLLEYACIGDSGMRRINVDLALLLENAVQRLDVAMKEIGASVEVDALPVVIGDPLLITQLFQNLIENALKFRTSKPPRIHVHGGHHDGEWRIEVSDNGIGIPERDAKRIFGIFERLHPRDYPGSGVGLAICRKIVERQGGRIWTEPAPSGGSSFVFTFPTSP